METEPLPGTAQIRLFSGEVVDTFPMREPCSRCQEDHGYITPRNGQDTVRCIGCGSYCYNAPKGETGRTVRRLTGQRELSPKERYRILERDCFRCLVCGRAASDACFLVVDHVISAADIAELGLPLPLFRDPENLMTLCETCNSGKGRTSLPAHLLAALILRRQIQAATESL